MENILSIIAVIAIIIQLIDFREERKQLVKYQIVVFFLWIYVIITSIIR